MNEIFNCGICRKRYNQEANKPLSLPCGHVFCEACVSQWKDGVCPIDKTRVNKHSLPCCYAILANLPRSNPKYLSCSEHQGKKIKYQCRVHDKFLCSNCILKHSGDGHSLASVSANLHSMRGELESLEGIFKRALRKADEALRDIEYQEKGLGQFYEKELIKVNVAFDSAIQLLQQKKEEHSAFLMKQLNEQSRMAEVHKFKLSKQADGIQHNFKKVLKFSSALENQYYQDFHHFVQSMQKEAKRHHISRPHIEYTFYQFTSKGQVDSIYIQDMGSVAKVQPNFENGNQKTFKSSNNVLKLNLNGIQQANSPRKGSATSRATRKDSQTELELLQLKQPKGGDHTYENLDKTLKAISIYGDSPVESNRSFQSIYQKMTQGCVISVKFQGQS